MGLMRQCWRDLWQEGSLEAIARLSKRDVYCGNEHGTEPCELLLHLHMLPDARGL